MTGSVVSRSGVNLVRYVTSSSRLVNGVNKTCPGFLVIRCQTACKLLSTASGRQQTFNNGCFFKLLYFLWVILVFS